VAWSWVCRVVSRASAAVRAEERAKDLRWRVEGEGGEVYGSNGVSVGIVGAGLRKEGRKVLSVNIVVRHSHEAGPG
jgi:hypothetical protein